MRILLIALHGDLPPVLEKILNPENEYCAIVTDEPDLAKKSLPDLENLFYPFYELGNFLENFYYDYCVCITNEKTVCNFPAQCRTYNLPRNKFVSLYNADSDYNFGVKKSLQFCKNHVGEFEIFSTSPDDKIFKSREKIFDLSFADQDLYYSYKLAENILAKENNFKYALIGLAPYSFNYDLSLGYDVNYMLLKYFIALGDLHNSCIGAEVYKNLLSENYLAQKISLENFVAEDLSGEKMTFRDKANARDLVDTWSGRNFPGTRAENVKIFDKYLALCEEKNIRPVIFLLPMSEGFIKHFSTERLGEFHQIINLALKKYPVAKFLDGWKLNFSDSDFYSVERMNLQGAEKFLSILDKFIYA